MNKWLRKSLVILFTIATFGLVAPPAALTIEKHTSEDTLEESSLQQFERQNFDLTNHHIDKDTYIDTLLLEAKQQSFEKFGEKIANVIENDFEEVIFPKMEEVISYYLNEQEDDHFKNIAISKIPTGGKTEKIFHIYDEETGEDVLRFHVRRDHPPQQGYWFNFHYHTYHDSFQSHKELGSIYWDKNTPPNWKSYQ
ncbi:YpjP family protein [Metabacillus herbersteinensis]|uniref:YpjP family protein n=1 Tax=Metabacillus herbersteinensis TaxID=283816 RepID=A0ABV6GFK9_9BACI